jgi:3-hydroxyacyl-CoA dehydrogenase
MEQTKIALLGLGLMGSGMAGRLLDAGYPLSIWNRTPGKTQALADRGAKVANSPRAAAKAGAGGDQHAGRCPRLPRRVDGPRRGPGRRCSGNHPGGVQHGHRGVD